MPATMHGARLKMAKRQSLPPKEVIIQVGSPLGNGKPLSGLCESLKWLKYLSLVKFVKSWYRYK
jgi:hypothetical protein